MRFKKTIKTSMVAIPGIFFVAETGFGENALTNSAAYEATLDLRILSQASGGIRADSKSAVTGSSSKISSLIGPKWMLIYPSGIGVGLSYYSIINSGIKGYQDQGSIDDLSSSNGVTATQGVVWHDYMAANVEYRFHQANEDGFKVLGNLGFGNAGFTQKYTSSGSVELEDTAVKSSAVSVLELGAAYSMALGNQYTTDAGLVYHLVNDSAWSHLSTLALSLSLTKIISE